MVAAINYWILLGYPAIVALACLLAFGLWALQRARRAPYLAVVSGAEAILRDHNIEQGYEKDAWPF